MKEEKYLKEVYGTQAPFKVPEGYFDDFSDRIMQILPERQAVLVDLKSSGWKRWRPYVAAACFCAFVMGAVTLVGHDRNSGKSYAVAKSSTEISIDQTVDYVMYDNDDIYTYLADN